jgi:LysM domain
VIALARLYDRGAMVRRNPARYLAPLALVATLVGTLLIVSLSLSTGSRTTHHASLSDQRARYAQQTFYTVQSGDSLSVIAAKTGATVASLERLNRTVSPSRLQPGQRLRLRR